jgi:hypothetical protein
MMAKSFARTSLLAGIPAGVAFGVMTHIQANLVPFPLLWAMPWYLLFLAWVFALTSVSMRSSRGLSVAVRGLALLPVGILLATLLYGAWGEFQPLVAVVLLAMIPAALPRRGALALLVMMLVPLTASIYFLEQTDEIPLWHRIGAERFGPDAWIWHLGSHLVAACLVGRVCVGELMKALPTSKRFADWLLACVAGVGACLLLMEWLPPRFFTSIVEIPIVIGIVATIGGVAWFSPRAASAL